MYQQIRAMKGRGVPVAPRALTVGQVFRLDGVKYRVQEPPVSEPSGSVRVEAYNEDNQHGSLFLSPDSLNVRVIGELDVDGTVRRVRNGWERE